MNTKNKFKERFFELKEYYLKNGNLEIPIKHSAYKTLKKTRISVKDGIYSFEEIKQLEI